jgi:hypothetical protein
MDQKRMYYVNRGRANRLDNSGQLNGSGAIDHRDRRSVDLQLRQICVDSIAAQSGLCWLVCVSGEDLVGQSERVCWIVM